MKVGAATGGMVGAVGAGRAAGIARDQQRHDPQRNGARREPVATCERGPLRGVPPGAASEELVAAIKDYLRHHNADPKPFVWNTTGRHHPGQGQEVSGPCRVEKTSDPQACRCVIGAAG